MMIDPRWHAAQPLSAFLAGEDTDAEYLDPLYSLVLGALTQWFSPRGLGKTHLLHALLVELARSGKRVLLLDRDNPRREVRRRLRAWGAAALDSAASFRVMTRDDVDSLVGALRAATPAAALAVSTDLWHNGWSLVLIIGLLTSEWLLRRKWGLR